MRHTDQTRSDATGVARTDGGGTCRLSPAPRTLPRCQGMQCSTSCPAMLRLRLSAPACRAHHPVCVRRGTNSLTMNSILGVATITNQPAVSCVPCVTSHVTKVKSGKTACNIGPEKDLRRYSPCQKEFVVELRGISGVEQPVAAVRCRIFCDHQAREAQVKLHVLRICERPVGCLHEVGDVVCQAPGLWGGPIRGDDRIGVLWRRRRRRRRRRRGARRRRPLIAALHISSETNAAAYKSIVKFVPITIMCTTDA